MNYNCIATCHFGLEKALSFEIRRAGGSDLRVTDGHICFFGDERVVACVNLTSAIAERVGIVIAERENARTFDDIFAAVTTSDAFMITADGQFPIVKGTSVSSQLTSIPALQRTIKKALAQAIKSLYSNEIAGDPVETGVLFPVRFLLFKNHFTLFMDTSGDGLHKRGYRERAGAAPIRETLAAGILDLARVKSGDVVIDPFCGSGTIAIEAALRICHMPVGVNRTFVSEEWSADFKAAYDALRRQYRKQPGLNPEKVVAYGYDADPNAIALSKENAEKAGVSAFTRFDLLDIRAFSYARAKRSGCCQPAKIITNPPYGERLMNGQESEVAELYRVMGEVFFPRGENELHVITSFEQIQSYFGEKAAKNRKLYNGMMLCRLFSYI